MHQRAPYDLTASSSCQQLTAFQLNLFNSTILLEKSIHSSVISMTGISYFDLLRINTEKTVDELIELKGIHKLRNFVDDIEIYEANELLKINNWNGCLVLHQATDEAILHLKRLNLGRTTISRAEVAKDVPFDNREDAEAYIKEFQENHYMRFSTGNMRCGNTLYMGKEEGELSIIYNVSYVPVKPKLGRINVAHIEFVIHFNKNVKRILKIKDIYDLRKAEEHFNELYEKYIVRTKVNRNIFKKYFPNDNASNMEELVSVVTNKKNRLRDAIQRNDTLNIICDKRMKEYFGVKDSISLTDKEERILHQSMKYWTKKS